jgi:superfamily I DNA/RNA helicase
MMTLQFTPTQERIIEADFSRSIAIVGPSRSGKSAALQARIDRYRASVGLPYLAASHPRQLVALAFAALEAGGKSVRIIDDIEARRDFERCAQTLLELDWPDIATGELDPEVAALRSPDRFLESAYRLIRKLRDGEIDPRTFIEKSLAGATEFYAKPPNFAHADLIWATKDIHRDSLDVTPQELQRQYRREIDLAKIIHRLYQAFVECTFASNTLAAGDAIALAIAHLRANPAIGETVRERYAHAFVDEMQEATPVQRALLDAIYAAPGYAVTVCGDARCATSRFRGARPDVAFAGFEWIELGPRYDAAPLLELHRAKTQREEAAFFAQRVREALDRGVSPSEIAVLFRSSADVEVYLDALLDLDIPAAAGGDVNLFADRRVLDALALLWNVWDPFRHEWMLRTLAGKSMGLSDASVAVLCADPPDPQTALFTLEDEPAPTARVSRWDPKRDLRLGWNVLRGDADASLAATALERVRTFRRLRAGWVKAMNELPFAGFVRKVWSEGLARDGAANSARALAQQHVLRMLLHRLDAMHRERPGAMLGDLLEDATARAEVNGETCAANEDPAFVRLISVDEARGKTFAFVAIPDARAGSFPRWYAPDAFMWSRVLGMIPRENVGDAKASRTAKFSYYLYRSKPREAYNLQERQAFDYACSRARATLLVTAWGTPTRGVSAPEFLEELRKQG